MAAESAAETRGRPVLLGTLGAALEWYDFTLYVYLAPVIGGLFFPSSNSLDSLLATFGVFAAGYVMRPLGAALFGNYGDTRGRKAALGLSIGLMMGAMALIGLLPTEGSIGAAAPALLVLLRLVQGIALGGEFSGSIVLLQESAPTERRGFVTNLVQISTGAGVLLSAGTATALHAVFSESQMDTIGWRIPFFIGAALGLLALLLLRGAEETDEFEQQAAGGPQEMPFRELIETERPALLESFFLNGYQAFIYYVVATFVPTYVSSLLGAPPERALLAATTAALIFMVACPYAGGWSDRAGRKPLLVGGAVAMAFAALPLFLLVGDTGFAAVLVGQAALMCIVVVFTAPALVTATELFTTRTRYSGVAVSYNLGAAIFGGTAPLLATAAIKVTGFDEAPALLLIVASLLVLLVVARTPETAPVITGEASRE